MKLLCIAALFATTMNAPAGREFEREHENVRACLSVYTGESEEFARQAAEVRGQLTKVPVGALERSSLESKLKELESVQRTLAVAADEARLALQRIEADPTYKLMKAVAADKRRPSSGNLSGIWHSGANLVGYTMQLTQDGDYVSGEGFHWGCMGIGKTFRITGTYRAGSLRLTFIEASGATESVVLARTGPPDRPRFTASAGKRVRTLIPRSN